MKRWILALVILALSATAAFCDSKKDNWQLLAEQTTGGDAKELVVNRMIRAVQIECSEGSVIVNTVVIREGGSKNPITVARRFNQGEKQDIDLGSVRMVTGLRISDGGRGKYKINTK